MSRDRGSHAAHPALNENVSRQLARRQLLQGLLCHDRIALHHVAGHVHVALVGGVGDDVPAVLSGILCGAADRVVIVARHHDDARAIALDGLLARFTDGSVNIDYALAAELLRAPGDGPAMVAVGGTGDGDAGYDVGMAPPDEVGGGGGWSHSALGKLGDQQAQDRVGAAQRFEATEAEASAFVLVPEAADSCGSGQAWERVQRRRLIALPGCDLLPGRGVGRVVQDLPLALAVGRIQGCCAGVGHMAQRIRRVE